MSKPKLTYFPIPGRAGPIRLAAYVGGVDIEDERIPHPVFGERKAAGAFPLGSVPVIEVNGQVYCQSAAILRYIGKLGGLYPSDPLEALAVDQVIDTLAEVGDLLTPSMREEDQEKKLAARKELVENPLKLPKFFGAVNKWAANGHIVGGKLTIADLNIFGIILFFTSGRLDGIDTTWLPTTFPNIAKTAELVKAHPKVAEYLAKEQAAAAAAAAASK